MTTLRITTSRGEVVREPDRAAVAATVVSAGRTGPGAFVVLDGESAAHSSGAPFLQATRLDGPAWLVEVWRVAPGERYRTIVGDDAAVTRVFWSWAAGTDAWQQLHWQQVGAPPLAAAG